MCCVDCDTYRTARQRVWKVKIKSNFQHLLLSHNHSFITQASHTPISLAGKQRGVTVHDSNNAGREEKKLLLLLSHLRVTGCLAFLYNWCKQPGPGKDIGGPHGKDAHA